MYQTISLQDYRLSYPRSDSVPTISQRGLIGPVMLRQHRRALRRARIRAAFGRVWAIGLEVLIWLRKASATPSSRTNDEPVAEATAQRA